MVITNWLHRLKERPYDPIPTEAALKVLKNAEFSVWKDGSISMTIEADNAALDINITDEGQIHTIHQHIGKLK